MNETGGAGRLSEPRDVFALVISGAGRPLDADAVGAHTFARTVNYEEHISISPGVRSGKPCIRGTRITVYDVLEYLAGGMTEAEILADFPDLHPEQIRACLGFAAARERRLAGSSAA